MIFKCKKSDIVNFPTEKFVTYLQGLRRGDYLVEVKRQAAKRSNEQNKLYHGVWLPIIADWMGEVDREEVCRDLKKHLGYCQVVVNKLGDKTLKCQSTADMNKVEMSVFLEKVEFLMAGHGVSLPSTEIEEI